MRFVLYDDESLEPITVINLPITERDALSQPVWRCPIPPDLCHSPWAKENRSPTLQKMPVVEIFFEKFVRFHRSGEQRTIMAFTKAADLAMLLNPDWLPGQRSAVNYLQDQNDLLTSLLMKAL